MGECNKCIVFRYSYFSYTLLFLLPLLASCIFILRYTEKRNIFTKKNWNRRKSFYVYKFATMVKNSENIGAGTLALKNDSEFSLLENFYVKLR